MKKFLVLTIAFLMMFTGIAYASHSTEKVSKWTPAFYGNVYVWDDNAPFLWAVISGVKANNEWLEIQDKITPLINKGEVISVRITAPYKYSRIRIYYEGHIYTFRLHPYLLGRNFILFTFSGGG